MVKGPFRPTSDTRGMDCKEVQAQLLAYERRDLHPDLITPSICIYTSANSAGRRSKRTSCWNHVCIEKERGPGRSRRKKSLIVWIGALEKLYGKV
jgi:hypothetical protein